MRVQPAKDAAARNAIAIEAIGSERYGMKVEAFAVFDDEAKRDAMVALFPKSTKVYASTLTSYEDDKPVKRPTLCFIVNFKRNGVTGEFNETGARRLRSFLKTADKAGVGIEVDAQEDVNWSADTVVLRTREDIERHFGL